MRPTATVRVLDETAKLRQAVRMGGRAFLARFGAFVRTRARSSMRRRKGAISDPGAPPLDHGGPLRGLLLFAVDAARQSVVIGPLAFAGARTEPTAAPRALEFGGEVQVRLRGRKATKVNRVRARPFMRPAFAATSRGLGDMLRGSIRG